MSSYLPFKLCSGNFLVLAQKCLYWEEERAIILSDLHLGKSGHFRKNGIPIPQNVFKDDMQRLFSLIQFFRPERVIIAGDLFHSRSNSEHDFFKRWRSDIKDVAIELVLGNHDILQQQWYTDAGVVLHQKHLHLGSFCFVHDLNDVAENEDSYVISGHVHPSVKISGSGKQTVHLACFYFGKHYAILPAFGGFTGTAVINPRKGDSVFGIAEKTVIQLQ